MPNQEKYILVSLEEEKAKQLANIISNATSRKILDYLSTKDEASETEIAKELNSPLSTIHYNLQQLKKNNLVEVKHFMYSNKGKRVEFYRVVKKFIVIAPKYSQPGLLKNILPLFLISALIGGLIQVFTNTKNMVFTDTLQKAASQEMAAPLAQVSPQVTNYYGLWFLFGAWFILIIYIIIQNIKKK
ncbi:MAG: helix-turn-helix domain-containing protein [Nanoarchaeota archaeon]